MLIMTYKRNRKRGIIFFALVVWTALNARFITTIPVGLEVIMFPFFVPPANPIKNPRSWYGQRGHLGFLWLPLAGSTKDNWSTKETESIY